MCVLGGGLFSLSEGYGELVHGPGQRAVADTGLRGRPQQGPSAVLGLIPFSAQLSSGKA